ncbi:MAG: sugar phosphate nucleotidyltransferase [bacterium]|nr:sugar phosphate nucleotidyltransferase [bacterium]
MDFSKFQIIILAAGKGTRMNNGELPKPLIAIHGKPMITYLAKAVLESGVSDKPAVVIGYLGDKIKDALGENFRYIEQGEPLGTGHAVAITEPFFKDKEHIIILYGDHPLVSEKTIRTLAETHLTRGATLSMGTATVSDFKEWRAPFYDFGRIKRDEAGNIIAIVEKKDSTEAELAITEVNPSYFCFKASWLWENLKKIDNKNASGEYYLTSLISQAFEERTPISSIPIDPIEALGINTPLQLRMVEEVLRSKFYNTTAENFIADVGRESASGGPSRGEQKRFNTPR